MSDSLTTNPDPDAVVPVRTSDYGDGTGQQEASATFKFNGRIISELSHRPPNSDRTCLNPGEEIIIQIFVEDSDDPDRVDMLATISHSFNLLGYEFAVAKVVSIFEDTPYDTDERLVGCSFLIECCPSGFELDDADDDSQLFATALSAADDYTRKFLATSSLMKAIE